MNRRKTNPRSALKAILATLILLAGMLPASPALADDSSTTDEFTGLRGVITALPATASFVGDWKVNLKVVHVTATTVINQENGKVAVGAFAEVKGTLNSDGSLTATKIEIGMGSIGGISLTFIGTVDELPSTPNRVGDWKVSGRTVHVTAMTHIEQENGPVAVGATVRVQGLVQPDLTINALEIETRPGFSLETKFIGKIESLPDTPDRTGDWKVSGRTVHVSSATTINQSDAPVAVGTIVKVEGTLQSDGSLNATKIETIRTPDSEDQHVRFFGKVESLPGTPGQIGDWKVSGRTVHVTSGTKIREEAGPVAVGSFVEVEGSRQSDGSINASEIEVEKVFCNFCGDAGFIRFFGRITALPAQGLIGEWTVGGQKVQVTQNTIINQEHGQVAVGALVEVFAVKQNDTLVAVKIEVKLAAGDSLGFVRFVGVVKELPGGQTLIGDWKVGDRTVHVSDSTRIDKERGPVVVGAVVEVKGNLRSDGSIDATEIEVKTDIVVPPGAVGFTIFFGTVSAFPAGLIGDWTVAGKTVHVSAATKIEQRRGTVAVGALVEVRGFLRSDGSVDAVKIEVKATSVSGGAIVTLVEFIGKITSLPDTTNLTGEWTVDGRKVRVSESTRIRRENSAVAVGALVEVRGALQPDNSIDAVTIEVKPASTFMSFAPLASVSAGSYQADNGSESIIASFGSNLSATTQVATKLPLPTTLGGVSVLVDGKPAGLFFVSPTQINYLVPPETASGDAQVTVMNGNSVVAQGRLSAPGVAPSLFTADASGQGLPAGLLLRVKANQQQSYEPLARFDSAQNRIVPVPIQRNAGDTLYLVLFGSGIRNAPDSDGNPGNGVAENVQVTIGGVNAQVLFAGPAPGFAGLDQLNVQIPADVAAGANVTIQVRVSDGQGTLIRANTVTVTIQ
ncbi:MAG TPA: DUF5666 domain-containing protein [Blastocatellia bacterium]|nr:DUF5666 domain-containing protein [Blastocatellia bacterium]